MIEEMERDERVFLMGEEVGHYQGAYKVTEGMLERFGAKRVIDAPIAESGFAGIGIGAAMVGLRPIIEFMTWNFSAVAFDQILSNAAKIRQMSGGQFTVPIVFRAPNGSAAQVGAQHSHAMEHFYAHMPGLKVIAPAMPADAKGLLKTAIRDDNPVLCFESETLYSVKGEVPDDPDHLVPMGLANIAREGKDATVVAWSRIVHVALEAAKILEKEGIDVEVIDLRSLRPLDTDTVIDSIAKTHRAVIAGEGWPYGGVGAEIVRPHPAARLRRARRAGRAGSNHGRADALQREARAARHPAGGGHRRSGQARALPVRSKWPSSSRCPSCPPR